MLKKCCSNVPVLWAMMILSAVAYGGQNKKTLFWNSSGVPKSLNVSYSMSKSINLEATQSPSERVTVKRVDVIWQYEKISKNKVAAQPKMLNIKLRFFGIKGYQRKGPKEQVVASIAEATSVLEVNKNTFGRPRIKISKAQGAHAKEYVRKLTRDAVQTLLMPYPTSNEIEIGVHSSWRSWLHQDQEWASPYTFKLTKIKSVSKPTPQPKSLLEGQQPAEGRAPIIKTSEKKVAIIHMLINRRSSSVYFTIDADDRVIDVSGDVVRKDPNGKRQVASTRMKIISND